MSLSLLAAGAAQAQVKLAVAGPVTGANAAFGAQLTQGVQQAAEDINKAGGILGQKIEVEIGDDVSDPKQGVSVANKFVGDGVKFVVGHFNSGVTMPASDVYAENGVLFITPSATNPKITDRKLWDAFRTCGRDDQQGMVWAELARDKLKGKKIAVIHDKTTYGKGLADAALENMHKFGVKEVLYEGVNTGEKDYSAIVSKIKDSGADYLMWGGLHTEGGLILRQMRDQGMNTIMISGDGITDSEFAAIGGPGVEGTLMTFGPEPRNNPNAKEAVDSFKAKGFDPQGYTLYSYAAVQIMKQAAEKASSLDPKKSRKSCIPACPSTPSSATSPTTRKATARPSTMSGMSGRRAPTARSASCNSECANRQHVPAIASALGKPSDESPLQRLNCCDPRNDYGGRMLS